MSSTRPEQSEVPSKDAAQIADYAVEAVSVLYANGYVHGKGGELFDPKGKITRAEIVQLIDNVMGTMMGVFTHIKWIHLSIDIDNHNHLIYSN